MSIRPLVNWLKVDRRTSGSKKLFEEIHESVVDNMMAGIEEVLGQHGDFYLRVSGAARGLLPPGEGQHGDFYLRVRGAARGLLPPGAWGSTGTFTSG